MEPSDYRYSASIVYNNFPWPEPNEKQCAAIEATTQAILDARDAQPQSTLADLYDPLTMPAELHPLSRHPAPSPPVILREAKRSRRIAICSCGRWYWVLQLRAA
jgi:hypothetical protein